MKKFVASLVVVAFVSTSAFGGIVTFDPAVVAVSAGDAAVFNVGVVAEAPLDAGFTNGDFVFGSNDMPFVDFSYDAEWLAATTFQPTASYDITGLYLHDLFVGGSAPSAFGPALALGTITLDTTGLADGTYDVVVSADNDYDTSRLGLGATADRLFGMGQIVIPEPATLALLGLGGLVALRRRR